MAEVPYTLPGDVVEVELKRIKKKKTYTGLIQSFQATSPLRVQPRCIHFARCGGCSFQHMPYEMQLKMKEDHIKEGFSPFLTENATFYPIIPSPPWAYRNKMEYTFSQDKKGEKFFGLILAKSRGKAFNLTECHLVDPWFANTVVRIRKWWEESSLKAYHHYENTGALRTLILRHGITTGDRMVMLTVSGNPDFAIKQRELDTFIAAVKEVATPDDKEAALSIVLRVQQVIKGTPTQFYEMILSGPDHIRERIVVEEGVPPFELHISPQAFFQPNTFTAQTLYQKAIELGNISSDDVVYDLYCGTGVFGMCASRKAKKVIAIELSKEAVYDGTVNSERLGLQNFTIYSGDVATVLKEKKQELPKPDVIIIDPPRAGLDPKAIQEVISLFPRTIVFVSCNPKTQAENVKEFLNAGYLVTQVQPVDQFPHTPHVENIVILQKQMVCGL